MRHITILNYKLLKGRSLITVSLQAIFSFITFVYPVTAMNTSPQRHTVQEVSSNVNGSPADDLASQIDHLSRSSDSWNNGYLALVVFAVLVGGVTAYFQYTAVKKARLLADAQAELGRVKEIQLNTELKSKDLQIAQLNKATAELDKTASDARERAGNAEAHLAEANARASEANARAKEAEAKVASADAASKDAVAKVASAEARIAEANRAAAEANVIAERERLARLQLEARLADRDLTPTQQNRIILALSKFPHTNIDAVFWGDTFEIKQIGGSILECLRRAGWTVNAESALGGGGTVRGILVGVKPNSDSQTVEAANQLISQLQDSGLASGPWDFNKMEFPGTSVGGSFARKASIKIFIGSKP